MRVTGLGQIKRAFPTHSPALFPKRTQNQNSNLLHKFYSRCGTDSFPPHNKSRATLERSDRFSHHLQGKSEKGRCCRQGRLLGSSAYSTEDSRSPLLALSSTFFKKKKKQLLLSKNNTSRSMGGRPPGLGNDVTGHQWKEGKGGGTITASAAGPPSLLHLVATVCRLHLLATAHSEPLSPG